MKRVHVAESHLARTVLEKAGRGVFSSVDLEDPIRELSDVDAALQVQAEEISRLRHELTETGRGGKGSDSGEPAAAAAAQAADEAVSADSRPRLRRSRENEPTA